jgi:hypothetical protein
MKNSQANCELLGTGSKASDHSHIQRVTPLQTKSKKYKIGTLRHRVAPRNDLVVVVGVAKSIDRGHSSRAFPCRQDGGNNCDDGLLAIRVHNATISLSFCLRHTKTRRYMTLNRH